MPKPLTLMTVMLASGALCVAAPRAHAQDATAATPPQSSSPNANAKVSVTEAAIARSIADRMPSDTGSAFPASVGELYAWTKLTGAAGTTVHHVWYHGDTKAADVSIDVGGSPWRAWSKKMITPADTGTWRVEVTDGQGNLLDTLHFSVSAPPSTTSR